MKIAFIGDIALIGKYNLEKNPLVKKKIVTLAEKLSRYDYVIGNLESPLTDIDMTWVCKSMHLKTPTINIDLLRYLNIDAVSLANNHMYDYGKNGLVETINTLEANGIEWFGVNSKSLMKKINGEKLSISGFCCYSTNGSGYIKNNNNEGVNLLTYENVMKQLDKDRENGAFSILSFHWGDEHTNYPNFEHISLANEIAKNKDVLICGHHSHVVQGIQKINKSLVAYSLGNFLFDDCVSINGNFVLKQNKSNKKSFIFEVEIENGSITNQRSHGFRDEDEDFAFFDIESELSQLSKPIEEIYDVDKYEDLRRAQIAKVVEEKFGKRNFEWLMHRMNYYSIGAYLTTKIRKKKYLVEKEKFLGRS